MLSSEGNESGEKTTIGLISKQTNKKHYSGLGELLLSLKQSFTPFISGVAHFTLDLFWIGFFARSFSHLKPCNVSRSQKNELRQFYLC